MIDTTQTNYILADTRDEVLNTPPGPGLLAISKDTSSLFVSDGNRWVETNITYKHNIEHAVTANASLTQSPLLHFDTSVTNSMENIRGVTISEDEPVARINSLVSNESLIAHSHHSGVYTENDVNNNSSIVLAGNQGMIPDLKQAQKRDGAMTIICVLTPTPNVLGNDSLGRPSGIERRWDSPADADVNDANTYGPNRYSTSVISSAQYYLNTFQHSNQGGVISHFVYLSPSNQTTHVYNSGNTHVNWSFPQSYMKLATDPVYWFDESEVSDPVNGGPGNRVHHYNQNYIGKPQIFSIRVESNKQMSVGGATKVKLHTFHLSNYNANTSFSLMDSSAYQVKSSELHHGLALGKTLGGYGNHTFNVYMNWHEMMYFDKYLTDKDLNLLGETLANKWNTGTGDTWRL